MSDYSYTFTTPSSLALPATACGISGVSFRLQVHWRLLVVEQSQPGKDAFSIGQAGVKNSFLPSKDLPEEPGSPGFEPAECSPPAYWFRSPGSAPNRNPSLRN